jgi:hypothetical protein
MTWLLIMVVLQISPTDTFVKHSEVIDTFYNDRECIKAMQDIFAKAREEGTEVPKMVNFGCVPLKGRGI